MSLLWDLFSCSRNPYVRLICHTMYLNRFLLMLEMFAVFRCGRAWMLSRLEEWCSERPTLPTPNPAPSEEISVLKWAGKCVVKRYFKHHPVVCCDDKGYITWDHEMTFHAVCKVCHVWKQSVKLQIRLTPQIHVSHIVPLSFARTACENFNLLPFKH